MSAQPRPNLSHLSQDLDHRLDALLEAVESELAQADRIVRAAKARAVDLRRQRDSLVAMRQLAVRPQLRVVSAPAYPTKPRAVMALLRANPGREFRLVQIRHELIARG